jgi:competence protein ComEA
VLIVLAALWAVQDLCAKKKPPAHPVNLNTASAAELQQVHGIGPATADKILQARKSYGAFKSIDDLEAIRGIGPKRLEKMRKYLTVGKPAHGKTPSTQALAASPKSSPPKKSSAGPVPKDTPPPAGDEKE